MHNIEKFGIYLPNDTEKWFKVDFRSKDRADWFAEANDLEPNEYEVRPTHIKPVISLPQPIELKEVA